MSRSMVSEKWSRGQVLHHVDKLGSLLARVPEGLEQSEKAYRVRLSLTGL